MPKVHNDLYARMNAGQAAARERDGAAAEDALCEALELIDAAIGGSSDEPKSLAKKLSAAGAQALEAGFQLATTSIVNDNLAAARDHLLEACSPAGAAPRDAAADEGGNGDDDQAGNPGSPEPEAAPKKKRRKKARTKKKTRRGRRS
ncbi:MAG: hypothetical protein V3U03_17530 [Myxococcota bacterium]